MGGVGSGKSILMAGILGEVPVFRGANRSSGTGIVRFGGNEEAFRGDLRGNNATFRYAGDATTTTNSAHQARFRGSVGEVKLDVNDNGHRGSGGGDREEMVRGRGEVEVVGVDAGLDVDNSDAVRDRGARRTTRRGERHRGQSGRKRNRQRRGDTTVTPILADRNTRICYAAQAPWVMSGTVRENILFGLPMDAGRYRLTKSPLL